MIVNNAWKILSVGLLAASAHAECPTTADVTSATACTATGIKAELERLGCAAGQIPSDEAIKKACKAASLEFGSITNNHYQFDKNYMDGGTAWNDDGETKFVDIDEDRINRVNSAVAVSSPILWPEYEALDEYLKIEATDETDEGNYGPSYMSNFNLTESCQLNTVMCCFTNKRDNTDAFDDNTEVCSHDLRDSRRSNHIQRGWAEYDNNPETHCTGFTWSNDENDASNRYKGNSLFDISFLNTVENGYIKNVPSAPMCSCIEKMPVVTSAACRKTTVENESVTFHIEANELLVKSIDANVVFEDCENGMKLEAFTEDLVPSQITAGTSCDNEREAMRNEKFWVDGDNSYFEVDESEWTKFIGQGLLYYPIVPGEDGEVASDAADLDFRSKLGSDSDFIVRRVCSRCMPSHRDIYYRRFTAVPPADEYNLLDLFLNYWVDTNNTRGVDFNLYDSYAEADAGFANTEDSTDPNAWKYCNFNRANNGFPRDCNKDTVGKYYQYNTYRKGRNSPYFAYDNAFYTKAA